jgi:hypothetical protein
MASIKGMAIGELNPHLYSLILGVSYQGDSGKEEYETYNAIGQYFLDILGLIASLQEIESTHDDAYNS